MTALIVDGNNLLMRAVRAMERPGQPALSADGVATGPLLVFINCLSRHIKEEQPDKVVVCWDGGRSTFRVALHDGYKAHRVQATSDFEDGAFALTKEFLALSNIRQIERPGVEADDLIAWYWRNHRPLDDKLVILSNDKDFLQLLVQGQVEIVRVSSGGADTDRWTHERFVAERGYQPANEAMVMALMGDAGDGVPGIPGIGPKRAAKIVLDNKCQWDRIVNDERVYEHRAQVGMALRLVNLRDTEQRLELTPLPPFQPTDPSSVLYAPLLDFLGRYQLRSVKDRLSEQTLWGQP
jgi:DNA polymerase-1